MTRPLLKEAVPAAIHFLWDMRKIEAGESFLLDLIKQLMRQNFGKITRSIRKGTTREVTVLVPKSKAKVIAQAVRDVDDDIKVFEGVIGEGDKMNRLGGRYGGEPDKAIADPGDKDVENPVVMDSKKGGKNRGKGRTAKPRSKHFVNEAYAVYLRPTPKHHWQFNLIERDKNRAFTLAKKWKQQMIDYGKKNDKNWNVQAAVDVVDDIGGDISKYETGRTLSSKAKLL